MRNMWGMIQEPQELLLKAQGYLEIKAETQDNTANSYHWKNALVIEIMVAKEFKMKRIKLAKKIIILMYCELSRNIYSG